MTPKEQADLDQSIASLTDLHAAYYKRLITLGIPKDVAIEMTCTFIEAQIANSSSGQQQSGESE